jgi:hypothetical protein
MNKITDMLLAIDIVFALSSALDADKISYDDAIQSLINQVDSETIRSLYVGESEEFEAALAADDEPGNYKHPRPSISGWAWELVEGAADKLCL